MSARIDAEANPAISAEPVENDDTATCAEAVANTDAATFIEPATNGDLATSSEPLFVTQSGILRLHFSDVCVPPWDCIEFGHPPSSSASSSLESFAGSGEGSAPTPPAEEDPAQPVERVAADDNSDSEESMTQEDDDFTFLIEPLVDEILIPSEAEYDDEYDDDVTSEEDYEYFESLVVSGQLGQTDGVQSLMQYIQSQDFMERISTCVSVKITQEQVDECLNCPVCLEMFVLDEEATKLKCNHVFHTLCIEGWIKKKPNCPYCRTTTVGKLKMPHDDIEPPTSSAV